MTPIWTTRGFNGSKLSGLIVFSRVGRKKELLTMRSYVAASPALTRSTHTCSGDESDSVRTSSCPATSANCTVVRRGVSILAETRIHQFWWTERANRGDACRVRREEEMGRQRAIPPCVELLHVAPRPRSAATGNLYRLVAP